MGSSMSLTFNRKTIKIANTLWGLHYAINFQSLYTTFPCYRHCTDKGTQKVICFRSYLLSGVLLLVCLTPKLILFSPGSTPGSEVVGLGAHDLDHRGKNKLLSKVSMPCHIPTSAVEFTLAHTTWLPTLGNRLRLVFLSMWLTQNGTPLWFKFGVPQLWWLGTQLILFAFVWNACSSPLPIFVWIMFLIYLYYFFIYSSY